MIDGLVKKMRHTWMNEWVLYTGYKSVCQLESSNGGNTRRVSTSWSTDN